MFYLIIENLGNETCVSKSATDNYVNNMHIDCTNDITVPAGAIFKRSIKVKCVGGTGHLISAKVYQK